MKEGVGEAEIVDVIDLQLIESHLSSKCRHKKSLRDHSLRTPPTNGDEEEQSKKKKRGQWSHQKANKEHVHFI